MGKITECLIALVFSAIVALGLMTLCDFILTELEPKSLRESIEECPDPTNFDVTVPCDILP